MKTIKKTLAFILMLVALITILCACSNTSSASKSEPSEETSSTITPGSNSNLVTQIEEISPFYYGLARFETEDGKYGYIDINCNVVIDPIYIEAPKKFNTLAKVKTEDKTLIINQQNEAVYTVTGNEYYISDYSNGLFFVETNKETISGSVKTMTYYDVKGDIVFTLENTSKVIDKKITPSIATLQDLKEYLLSDFNEWGVAVVNVNGTNRFIDNKGNLILNEIIPQFVQNNYVIHNDNRLYYVDYDTGTIKRARAFSHTNAWACFDTKYLGNGYYASFDNRYDAGNGESNVYYGIYLNDQLVIDLTKISDLSNAKVRAVSAMKTNSGIYFALYAESTSGVFFSTLIDIEGNAKYTPTNEFQIGYLSYYFKPSSFYEQNFDAYDASAVLCKAKAPDTESYGYVDLLSGKWVIPAQYYEASNFYTSGDKSVAVVNGDTIINTKGEVLFTIVE